MKLITDAGSSKSEWMLVKEDGSKIMTELRGLNPVLHSEEFISETVVNGLKTAIQFQEIKEIFYYGAGCTAGENAGRMQASLKNIFQNAAIYVESDLLAAARALFFNNAGIACILGTGSNSGFFDGKKLHKTIPSLGYMLGDEGSGASIGMRFIKDILYRKAPELLAEEFLSEFSLYRENIIPYIYSLKQQNVFFAKVGGFLTKHHHDSYVEELIMKCFREFIEIQVYPYFEIWKNRQAGFVGSIAFFNKEILKKAADQFGLDIVMILQKPTERLVEYHCKF